LKFLSSYGFIVYALKKSVQFIVADSKSPPEIEKAEGLS